MKIIRLNRKEVSLARVCHACLEKVKLEIRESLTVESILPILAPQNFAGQPLKCSQTRKFLPGGKYGNKAFGSTPNEITKAATVVFEKLEPLAIGGFQKSGKPNAYALIASVAFGIMKKGGWS